MKAFHSYAEHIRDRMKDSSCRVHHARIVPSRLNSLPFINDSSHLEGKTPCMEQEERGRKIYLELVYNINLGTH